MKINFHSIDGTDRVLTYVVMCTRFRGKWLFVRHRERSTWEIPAGHIEPGETPDEAAAREMREETGATAFQLSPLCDYSVYSDGKTTYGRLYLATVSEKLDLLEFEIAETALFDEMPQNLTYPHIQPFLMQKAVSSVGSGV